MAEDYTKTSGGGSTILNGEETPVKLTPSIRPVFQNAGFPEEVIEGDALSQGHAQDFGLRDGDNAGAASQGTQPDYPTDLMGQFANGQDLRNKE